MVGAAVDRPSASNGWIQLVCRDADRVRPWAIEVVDGRIGGVAPIVRSDAVNVVTHSVTVGWRLLGLSVRGFHRLDELVLEQRAEGRWRRHPIPPLDDAMIDLSHAETGAIVAWNERVIDSPIGTLYISRHVDRGLLRVCGASTRPPLSGEGVGSDVAWPELMRSRERSTRPGASSSRVWRGNAAHVDVVRSALSCVRPDSYGRRVSRLARDRAFLDALAALDGIARCAARRRQVA